jgi:hypothetical protein
MMRETQVIPTQTKQTELTFASHAPDRGEPARSYTGNRLKHLPASAGWQRTQGWGADYFADWFLGYASYVILERAVPHVNDGTKPVQRRILHSMWEMEDGRYNKVANIIGNTMKYHPHGDQSIGDALVQMGQRELLIDTQGNWGTSSPGTVQPRLGTLKPVYPNSRSKWRSIPRPPPGSSPMTDATRSPSPCR